MSDPAEVRASDAERERVAAHLREHFAAGRLDAEELAERLEATYASRTVGELAGICGDLPGMSGPIPVSHGNQELTRRRAVLQRRAFQQAGGSFGAFAICSAIWAASGASGDFWPVWVLIAPAAFLARIFWGLHGPAPELDRVERELKRRSRHDRHLRHQRRRDRYLPAQEGAFDDSGRTADSGLAAGEESSRSSHGQPQQGQGRDFV